MKVSVLSYNIHKGYTAGNLRYVLTDIRDAINELDPQLIFLQEVVLSRPSAKGTIESQLELLAGDRWLYHAFGGTKRNRKGEIGNAVLSKFPIRTSEHIDISTNRVERRGILHVGVELPKRKEPLHAICAHLGLFRGGRRRQVAQVAGRIDTVIGPHEPFILAGDFNDWTEEGSRLLYEETGAREVFIHTSGRHAATFPSWRPMLRLDRIYCRGVTAERAQVLNMKLWKKLSDHTPIYAELEVH